MIPIYLTFFLSIEKIITGGKRKMMKKRNPYREVVFLLFLLFMEMSFSMGTGDTRVAFPLEMVLVEGGSFRMGDEFGDLWEGCRPVHAINLTYDYWIGKYEVTFNEYEAFCIETGKSKPDDWGWEPGTRPVMNVSWWDAIAYCNWLSGRERIAVAYRLQGEANEGSLLDSNGNVTTNVTQVRGYRLPMETEWEYAARGGKNSKGFMYSGSNSLDEVGWYNANSGSKTQEIKKKKANELGIFDMSGNVWEWCHDRYASYQIGTQTNLTGTNGGFLRLVRGGSWVMTANYCRSASRSSFDPSGTGPSLGFRLARTDLP